MSSGGGEKRCSSPMLHATSEIGGATTAMPRLLRRKSQRGNWFT